MYYSNPLNNISSPVPVIAKDFVEIDDPPMILCPFITPRARSSYKIVGGLKVSLDQYS